MFVIVPSNQEFSQHVELPLMKVLQYSTSNPLMISTQDCQHAEPFFRYGGSLTTGSLI